MEHYDRKGKQVPFECDSAEFLTHLIPRISVPRRGPNQTSEGPASGSGSGNPQATSPIAGLSPHKQVIITDLIIGCSLAMLGFATNATITGGYFTAHQGDWNYFDD